MALDSHVLCVKTERETIEIMRPKLTVSGKFNQFACYHQQLYPPRSLRCWVFVCDACDHNVMLRQRLSPHALQPGCCHSAETNPPYRVRPLGASVYCIDQSVQVSQMAACVNSRSALQSLAVLQTSRSHEDLRRLSVCATLTKRRSV